MLRLKRHGRVLCLGTRKLSLKKMNESIEQILSRICGEGFKRHTKQGTNLEPTLSVIGVPCYVGNSAGCHAVSTYLTKNSNAEKLYILCISYTHCKKVGFPLSGPLFSHPYLYPLLLCILLQYKKSMLRLINAN